MPRASSYQQNLRSAKLPPPLPKLPAGEKHLDATLLALAKRRKVESSTLPGVPFH
jgi:hypothetical protein